MCCSFVTSPVRFAISPSLSEQTSPKATSIRARGREPSASSQNRDATRQLPQSTCSRASQCCSTTTPLVQKPQKKLFVKLSSSWHPEGRLVEEQVGACRHRTPWCWHTMFCPPRTGRALAPGSCYPPPSPGQICTMTSVAGPATGKQNWQLSARVRTGRQEKATSFLRMSTQDKCVNSACTFLSLTHTPQQPQPFPSSQAGRMSPFLPRGSCLARQLVYQVMLTPQTHLS